MLSLVPFPNTSILLTSALISIPIISRYAVDHTLIGRVQRERRSLSENERADHKTEIRQ